MRHRGRHRKVVRHPRLRAALTVVALAATALVAPLATSGPAASHATVPTTAYDTLANHPEWLLSSSDPAVAALIADLEDPYAEHGIAYDSATIAAYRVPTVEGWATYVTAKPETMTVRLNPDLLYHTPEGDTAVSPRDVLARLLEGSAAPQAGIPGGGIPSTHLMDTLVDTVWGTVYDVLGTDFTALVQQGVDTAGQLISDSGPLVNQVLLLIDAVQAEAQRQADQIVASSGPLIDQAILTATAWLAEAQRIANQAITDSGPLVDQTVVTVTALVAEAIRQADAAVGSTGPLLDQVMLTLNSWRAVAEEQTNAAVQQALAALNELDPQGEAANVFNVVPIAVAAPPDVEDNIMTNPALPDGAREEHDGSSAYWATPSGLSGCPVISTTAYQRIVCWRIELQYENNDPARGFWQLHTDVSGISQDGRFMSRMWVEAAPDHNTSDQGWDALPLPSADFGGSEGCMTNGEQFSVASGGPVQVGYAWYWERTACEMYKSKSYDDQGHWASIWEGNPKVASQTRRAIMLKVPVKTSADKGVWWDLLTGQYTIH